MNHLSKTQQLEIAEYIKDNLERFISGDKSAIHNILKSKKHIKQLTKEFVKWKKIYQCDEEYIDEIALQTAIAEWYEKSRFSHDKDTCMIKCYL